MLERLTMDDLELSKSYVSFFDVYCSERAKFSLEKGHQGYRDLFDRLSQVVIGPSENGKPLATPHLLRNYTLIERTELYGVNNKHLPDILLSRVFGAVFMDTDIPIPEPREGEQQAPKHSFLKFVSFPNQTGLNIQLEFPPEVTLKITENVRNYLPAELVKDVTSYLRHSS